MDRHEKQDRKFPVFAGCLGALPISQAHEKNRPAALTGMARKGRFFSEKH
jgi:hypothetical protein